MKTDALRYLADALSEDIAATPESKILAEERDDSAQRPQLALAFEEILADAKALARERGTAEFDHLVERNTVPGNAAPAAAPGSEQAADNRSSW